MITPLASEIGDRVVRSVGVLIQSCCMMLFLMVIYK